MKPEERTKIEREIAELNSELKLKGQALQEDQRSAGMQEEKKLIEKAKIAINEVAKAEKYDLVIDGQSVLFAATDKDDLSSKVINKVK
jgi:outer membrane protein